ncbi:MAG: ComEC/Rec2 family competence protein, partial [Planctomycetota bacterium]
LILLLAVTKWNRTHRDNLVLTCLDVGHGQAILTQMPGGAKLLFDAGSLHKHDVGRRILLPFLDYSGISRLDAIIISHNDIDHTNGIPEIVQNCSVCAVYANDAFFEDADHWGTAKFLRQGLLEKGFAVRRLTEGLNPTPKASVKFLWPSPQVVQDHNLADNDKSLVTLIEFAGRRVLLCSDTEEFAQQQLLRLHPNLKADIVVAPHHGSATTLDPAFLKNLQPEILICSCGRTAHLKRRVAEPSDVPTCFYTPADGAIAVHISKDGTITSETFTKK